jgi:asparaginyl-tRNA synthetase
VNNYSVKNIYKKYKLLINQKIFVNGWIRNCRFQKELFFIDLNDGTFLEDLQIVLKNNEIINLNDIKENLQIGSAISIEGNLVLNQNLKKPFELLCSKIVFLSQNYELYPIQPKKHSRSFLRKISHLRLRTKLFGVIFRIRNIVTYAINDFFQKEGFLQVHTPIITTSDGEGAGELFKVTTFDFKKISLNENQEIDFRKDFFGKPTFLTVTGQLEAEAFAMAFSKVYTFGPTFRAETSNTLRHISEFWMIEPEMAFYNLEDNMLLAQNLIKRVIKFCLEKSREDFEFLDENIQNNLIEKLKYISELDEFPKIKYKKAIQILLENQNKFEISPCYGNDLSTEHEKFLTDVVFKKPVFIIDWPKEIKAFYMKNNSDNQTVAAMDLLVPQVGELIGGSQREDKLEVLEKKIEDFNISREELEWYLDLRRFGSCIHSGFGLGLERFLLFLTGLENIRDVIAFPRSYKKASF